MPQYLGIDYGSARIGLAVSDRSGRMSFPLRTISATGRPKTDALTVAQLEEAAEADAFVVGLPLNMDGSEGPQAKLTRRFASALALASDKPVEFFDERLTSFAADDALSQAGLNSKKRRGQRDHVAAHFMLRGFLDARESNG